MVSTYCDYYLYGMLKDDYYAQYPQNVRI
jgi:hypothetical protein